MFAKSLEKKTLYKAAQFEICNSDNSGFIYDFLLSLYFRKTPSPSFEEKFQQKMALRRETRRKVTEMKSKTTISHGFSKIKKNIKS